MAIFLKAILHHLLRGRERIYAGDTNRDFVVNLALSSSEISAGIMHTVHLIFIYMLFPCLHLHFHPFLRLSPLRQILDSMYLVAKTCFLIFGEILCTILWERVFGSEASPPYSNHAVKK